MKPYYNVPPVQQRAQRPVDESIAAEEFWLRPEAKRYLRRRIRSKLPPKWRKLLDLLDCATRGSPQDCVGTLKNR